MIYFNRKFLSTHFVWISLLSLCSLYLLSSLRVVSDITQFMPQNHSDKNIQLLLNELQQGNTARSLILRIKGDSSKKLAQLSQQLKSKLDKNKAFNSVHNGQQTIDPRQFISGKYKTLFDYRYLLSSNTTFSEKKLSASLKQRISELRSGLTIFKDTLVADPQNHFIQYLWKLTERGKTTHHHGVWFNKEKTAALLLVDLKLDNFDLDAQELAIKNIQQETNLLSINLSINNIHLDITGAASMAVKTRTAIQSTTKWLSSIAFILMSLLFWWAYQSIRLFFIAMLPLISAIIAALTVTNILFLHVHGIIIAFGITLLGVCLDYPVHLFSHRKKSQTAHETLHSIWPTLRLGVITTALAYLAMLGTGFAGLSQLSVFAISGLIVSLLVTRWIVPLWLEHNVNNKVSKNNITPHHKYLIYLSTLKFMPYHKLSIAVFILLFCSITLTSFYDSIWSKNIADLSPIPESAKKMDKSLRHSVGAPDVNHVFLLTDKNSELLLQRTETFKNKLIPLEKNNIVKSIFSVTDFIPSKKNQLQQQQQLPQTSKLKSNLHSALRSLPFKENIFTPFINDVERSKYLAPLNVEQILSSPLGKYLQQDLFFKDNEWISIIRLAGVQDETALLNWLSDKPEIQQNYLNLRQATSSLMSDYQQTALTRLLLGSFIIGLILLVVRPMHRVGIILLPIIFAVLLSISIQVLLGTHLTLFHILALLLIVGIGLDYSLFFDRHCASSEDYQHRLHGIFVSAASTIITFGILSFSDIPVLSALGQTVTFGVLGCFVLTLVFNINNNESLNNT